MPETLFETLSLTKIECGECSIVFAMPTSKYNRCRDQGEGWCCPNGHNRVFCKSENAKLQEQLNAERQKAVREQQAREQSQAETNELREKNNKITGKLSRVYKRVRNGVCPCCNRHFDNLEGHMKTKHGSRKGGAL